MENEFRKNFTFALKLIYYDNSWEIITGSAYAENEKEAIENYARNNISRILENQTGFSIKYKNGNFILKETNTIYCKLEE